jgi:hypothetical protein
MEFGLWGELKDETKVAWGARGIIERGSVSLLYDRQSWKGEQEDRKEFSKFLNSGPLPKAIERVEELLKTHDMRGDKSKLFTLYEDDQCRIVGNTNASYGYLYMLAEKK